MERPYGAAVRGLGTVINVLTVVGGTGVGVALGGRLPERTRTTVLQGIGLVVLAVGVQSFLDTRNAVFPIVSVAVGGLLGDALRIEYRLAQLGEALRRRFAARSSGSTFVEGFVTASLTFCIGPLTILGSIADGVRGDAELLVVKSALDGIVAIAYAASMGIGVGFSALVVAAVQGVLTLGGAGLGDVLTDRMIDELTATGGVMILGIGVRLLDIKRVPVASYLPGLVLAPVLVGLFAR
jgi:uncharacterized membrane protein YqgA involved in biofilm formation